MKSRILKVTLLIGACCFLGACSSSGSAGVKRNGGDVSVRGISSATGDTQ